MRLDSALVAQGLARSRNLAQRQIAAGQVLVNGSVELKASRKITPQDILNLTATEKYVSRGAYKLLAALQSFELSPAGAYALDLGASTGGFTQVLLEHGATQVAALDVGHNQLAPQLRSDRRVAVIEGFNARYLDAAKLQELTGIIARPTLVVGDLSFISLQHIFPAIAATAAPEAVVSLLIKPQFEVGAGAVSQGIVTDPQKRLSAIKQVLEYAAAAGFDTLGVAPSPLQGTNGNREYLGYWRHSAQPHPAKWYQQLDTLVLAEEE
ncbi:TlyA family RNA methyltransferase [Canibacter oris]|uniref:23S rRNA (Cytidine1920-2'-O)/16S rRNA (Cytidine1409-2'-O)-methyltransferase n=1 Tax=Canibacter oris TaxID=1365628 RepID=A0A840DLS2_9MICO|nr:TlyA family RNA methyltransferase [Canibacter oris]MBB4070937.1 23S rRNA (cytidine1920-2'-O)/16S rRNA (cytidine1409-2'-O)-methyltransferase [Canibacter oris]